MFRFLRSPVLSILLCMALAACATTQLKAAWKDPAYRDRPHKVMVISVAKKPLNRRVFEDEFVRQLGAHGVQGIASYTVLSDRQQDNRAAIADRVAELGADTVLVTRLVARKSVQVYVPGTNFLPPPYYTNWQDYYLYGYQNLNRPGYFAEDEYAVMETNLYQAHNNKLVWAASSETATIGSDQKLIRGYVAAMVNSLVEHGLLAK